MEWIVAALRLLAVVLAVVVWRSLPPFGKPRLSVWHIIGLAFVALGISATLGVWTFMVILAVGSGADPGLGWVTFAVPAMALTSLWVVPWRLTRSQDPGWAVAVTGATLTIAAQFSLLIIGIMAGLVFAM